MTETAPSSSASHVLALDFGGTKLAAAVVDTASGQILTYQRQSTPAEQGAAVSIQAMFALGRQALAETGIQRPARVGISFGGPVSPDRRTVLVSNHVADWEGIPLPALASKAFDCPATMDNDANAAALGAWAYDANRQPENMVYIQISTGVGAGLILNRRLYRGGALAGEFGHITMQSGGPKCTCGKHGCIESLCSGWALARDGRDALRAAAPNSPLYQMAQGRPENMDARVVLEAARAGDPLARAITEKAFTGLGTALANVICMLDPDRIILGGGIVHTRDVLDAIIGPVLDRETHPLFKNRCKLHYCTLDGQETLLGAALLTE